MANNRMALVCKDCMVGVPIAKFYPVYNEPSNSKLLPYGIGGKNEEGNSGWYMTGDISERLNEFYGRHNHDHDTTMMGEEQYFLGYESDGKEWQYERD